MHMQMPRMPHSSSEQWSAPYVRTWHGDGTRLVMWHMWPMIAAAWLLFMFGVMMGAKSAMMKHRMMMGGMCGPMGMRGGMGGPMGMHMRGGMPGKMGMGKGMMGGMMGMHGGMMGGMGPHHHHHGYGMPDCSCGEEKAEEGTPETPAET